MRTLHSLGHFQRSTLVGAIKCLPVHVTSSAPRGNIVTDHSAATTISLSCMRCNAIQVMARDLQEDDDISTRRRVWWRIYQRDDEIAKCLYSCCFPADAIRTGRRGGLECGLRVDGGGLRNETRARDHLSNWTDEMKLKARRFSTLRKSDDEWWTSMVVWGGVDIINYRPHKSNTGRGARVLKGF